MKSDVLCNGINSGQLRRKKKALSNNMSRIKVYKKGRQRSEFKI